MTIKTDMDPMEMTPQEWEAYRAKCRAAREAFIAEYDRNHQACPKCGSTRCSTTYMGIIVVIENGEVANKDEYQDTNTSTCFDCNWTGIVHERVPANANIGTG